MKNSMFKTIFIAGVVVVGALSASAADFPALCVEISPDHPLFLFRDSGAESPDAAGYAQHVVQVWQTLPEDLKPFSAIQIEAYGADMASRYQWFRGLLVPLQDLDIPTVVRIADGTTRYYFPLDRMEELLREFTCVKGIQAVNVPFEEYYESGMEDVLGAPPLVGWLTGAMDLAARYGRFMSLELDRIRWPRAMANTWCRPLYEKLRECEGYVLPIAACRGAHVVPQMSALLGLWLEGAAGQWGVGPQSTWYCDAHFVEPGMFGISETPAKMPPSLYRAMILNGAMIGATVYSFTVDADLWFGPSSHHWAEAIYPSLQEITDLSFIARQDFVRKNIKVAYQLGLSRTSEDFHLNLHDMDGVLDEGCLIRGAYGMERPGQIPELILNTGRYYWIPILSAYAPEEAVQSFEATIRPGTGMSPEQWTELLDRYYEAQAPGNAFITSVGLGTFIMNSSENQRESQSFRVETVPAPVRSFEATRQENGVLLAWPFREGDLTYKIYRRVLPDTRFTLLVNTIENRSYLDPSANPDQTIAYAITALTNETEPYEGIVAYGDYLALSNVQSRIGEEVVIGPLMSFAQSKKIETAHTTAAEAVSEIPEPRPLTPPQTWWPNYSGLDEAQRSIAAAIVERIETWDKAFSQEDLNEVMDLYAADYEDLQGWGNQYVRRAYKWFFEHYQACVMHRQIRQWDFSAYNTTGPEAEDVVPITVVDALPATDSDSALTTGIRPSSTAISNQIGVLLYCRFSGYALSDPTGRVADLPGYFPRTNTSEVWIYFAECEGLWRIVRTNPALPNFNDILSFSASPYDRLSLGPDS